jgi:hypothetical protein
VPIETIAYVDDLANRELVTSTECISAGGYHIPPMITFKGTYHLRKFFKNNIDSNILFSQSESSFVNDKLSCSILLGSGDPGRTGVATSSSDSVNQSSGLRYRTPVWEPELSA